MSSNEKTATMAIIIIIFIVSTSNECTLLFCEQEVNRVIFISQSHFFPSFSFDGCALCGFSILLFQYSGENLISATENDKSKKRICLFLLLLANRFIVLSATCNYKQTVNAYGPTPDDLTGLVARQAKIILKIKK